MNISLILRALIVASSLAGVAYFAVAIALSLVPMFYAFSVFIVCVFSGVVAIADI